MKKVAALFLILLMAAGCRTTTDLQVVQGFELDRYLGEWYEIARLPHGFEENLSRVTAEYTQRDDGSIKVLNKGYNEKSKEWESIEGSAKLKGGPNRGWLKVSFFKPFYASYKIVHIDDAYTQAIVTGPTYGYFWILARDPDLSGDPLQVLVDKAAGMGFETNRLIYVSHEPIPAS